MRMFRSQGQARMRKAGCAALLLILTGGVAPAAAQISEEGAKALADELAVYLGRGAIVDGILKVAPAGDAYEVTIDLQKAADGLKAPGAEVDLKVEPFRFKAAPAASGTWAVTSDSFPSISVRQKKPAGEETVDIAVPGYKFEGVYDPKLAAFTSGTLTSSGMNFISRSPEGDVVAQYGETRGTMTAQAAANGGVTARFQQKSASLVETIGMKGETPMNIKFTTGEIAMDASVEGARGQSMLQIVSFFAQNPEVQKIVAGQDDLRARLKAALPLWESTGGRVTAREIAVESPLGAFKLAEFGETITMSGLRKEGSYDIRISMKGFEAPPGIVPAWTTTILPKDLDIAANLSGFDLEAASRLLVDTFDLAKPEPWTKEDQAKLWTLFSEGSLKVTLPPSSLSSPTLTLSFEGEATVMPQPLVARAKVTADGLDATLADLQGSSDPDPNRMQALMVLGTAKGLAKADGGKAVWEIEAAKDGSISVNGQQMQPPTQP
jgi:hypothetical protein